MRIKILVLILAVITLQSCKKSQSESYVETEIEEVSDEYPDGTYSADVTYYNPNTGTRNTYTLNVEVEDHMVTVIHWPNGGWLDDSHFTPQELDSDGSCSFTSDAGYEYEIQITGEETSYTDESKMRNDLEDDQEAVTCPECGGEKEEYDEYCYYCKSKFTCSECGGKKDKFDKLCYDCKSKLEEEENQNNEE